MKLINGQSVAQENNCNTYREYIAKLHTINKKRPSWNGVIDSKKIVYARVDFGRWLADCPDCNGAEYVDHDDPFFFCLSCGNKAINGNAYTVIFPSNLDEIEDELLQRPVLDTIGNTDSEKALNAKSLLIGLSRSWVPGETIEDMKKQKKVLMDLVKKDKVK